LVKPLENIRVLDLSRYMAGPFCGKILVDLGADVIKVETPWGDEMRYMPPLVGRFSPAFIDLNRGKRGVTLNLKTEKGVEIFRELLRESDVVIENFSVGTMDRLGISYEEMKKVNPKVILASITGFGQYGPRSESHSFDMIGQAASGYMHLNAVEASQATGKEMPPMLLPEALGDSIPGAYAALSILAALNYRNITGEGMHVDVAQQDVMIYHSLSLPQYMATGITFPESRIKYPFGVYRTFEAKDGGIAIAAPSGPVLDRLAALLGKEEIDDGDVEEWVGDRSLGELMEELTGSDIPATPVYDLDDVISDPQSRAREMITEVEHPGFGVVKVTGIPLKSPELDLKVERSAPDLGQHNVEILTGVLGYDPSEIGELKKEGVI
jgi:crotonobetainyl-CoA:carnitine CoA-transferase CaiB-like acyl-CoA transferase